MHASSGLEDAAADVHSSFAQVCDSAAAAAWPLAAFCWQLSKLLQETAQCLHLSQH
jgi:hypothetical protein